MSPCTALGKYYDIRVPRGFCANYLSRIIDCAGISVGGVYAPLSPSRSCKLYGCASISRGNALAPCTGGWSVSGVLSWVSPPISLRPFQNLRVSSFGGLMGFV